MMPAPTPQPAVRKLGKANDSGHPALPPNPADEAAPVLHGLPAPQPAATPPVATAPPMVAPGRRRREPMVNHSTRIPLSLQDRLTRWVTSEAGRDRGDTVQSITGEGIKAVLDQLGAPE